MPTSTKTNRIHRRHFLWSLPLATACGGFPNLKHDWIAATSSGQALGSSVSIKVFHTSQTKAKAALSATFDELERIENLLSIYRPNSDVSRLNRDTFIHNPHPLFVQVLRYAQTLSKETQGAFDVTVQPLWRAFSDAKMEGRIPSNRDLAVARTRVDWTALILDNQYVQFCRPGMELTLNGIAQGFAADRVASILREHNVKHALVNTGEINTIDARPNGQSWAIGIQHPRKKKAYLALAELNGRCLATSGDYATPFTSDFSRHHIFDPQTGQSPMDLSSVSVVARTGMEADALSTAVFVLGPEKGTALVRQIPGADTLLVLKNGRTLMSSDFPLKV
jgi:thiamine biosynthesis lipoprotein